MKDNRGVNMQLLEACWYVARLLVIGCAVVYVVVAGMSYLADKLLPVRDAMEVSEEMP